jgi:ABC-2 type transport system permease protein
MTAADAPSFPLPGGPAAAGPLLSPVQELRVFRRLWLRIGGTLLRQTFHRAWFRLSLILLLSVVLWGGLFWFFFDGFLLLKKTITLGDVHDQMVRGLFGMFFAALLVMLVFSSGIILYGSLFRSRESAFLLTLPARVERVFLHKFQNAVILSSWGFLLLGSPMVMAFGLAARAPWYYFLMLLPFMVAFIYLPAAIGAILCLGIVYLVPRHRLWVMAIAASLAVGGAVWAVWSLAVHPAGEPFTPSWIQQMLGRLGVTEQRLLPSWWLSSGLIEASRGQWAEGLLFLALIASNALFFRQLAVAVAGRSYRAAYSALCGLENARRRVRPAWLDAAIIRSFRFLPMQVRLLIVKDLRLFRRDPLQWSQFLIFFGLLVLYFSNIQHFAYDIHYASWMSLVSFMNVCVVGLLLSTFNTRFIFPMVSLEGRSFWVLGLLPVRRETILWSKFLFAVMGAAIPSSLLIVLSDLKLDVPWPIMASHQLTCVLLSVGLAGIAVGLGAKLPNLREETPSRIAAGFGGTLNLVASTLFILVIVLLTALPCHFYFATKDRHMAALIPQARWSAYLYLGLLGGTLVSIVLTILAVVIPLRMGFRAFRRLEF